MFNQRLEAEDKHNRLTCDSGWWGYVERDNGTNRFNYTPSFLGVVLFPLVRKKLHELGLRSYRS